MAMDAAQPAPRIDRRSLGAWGEAVAARHLERLGMSVLDRNWRCREGEIDIVALDEGVLVICEVKTRSSDSFGIPAAAVTAVKIRRLRRLAVAWLRENPVRHHGIRFDVIAILAPAGSRSVIEHLRGVGG